MARPKEFDPDHVLDAAMDAFWSKGYAATSAQDLVDSTGLGRGSLYNAFSSKHRLFQEALRRYEDKWTTRQEAVLDGPGDIRERIRQVLMTVVEEESLRTPGPRGCLAVNAAVELAGLDPEVTAQVRHIFERVERALYTALARARRDGEIGPDKDPRALALFVLNSLYGLRVLGKTADRAALTGIVDTTLSTL
ncbi:TetR/AcrR family transcriptional regulator [Streptomyces broussonetiae]|uniref:TetR family transcriptional regulator n=1 Tax=Streptomyces broussonetiae TaxID=2686304 RepID=A0A6I6N239_9ACTN|nr:TetR/AcrR family transcriptional regulator [Streptomyces broussonetiae]QHA07248.1 TetR family transcriptional regulator [Streptomyces broussonetiae]